MAAAFIIALVTTLRTGSGRVGDRASAMIFVVVAALSSGAFFLGGSDMMTALAMSTCAALAFVTAMMLSPRLLVRSRGERANASRRTDGPPPVSATPVSEGALKHIVPLWGDAAAGAAVPPLMMTRVAVQQVIGAAQIALERSRRRHPGAQLSIDIAEVDADRDLDADAPRLAEALTIMLESALSRVTGVVTLTLRGTAKVGCAPESWDAPRRCRRCLRFRTPARGALRGQRGSPHGFPGTERPPA